MKKQITLIVLLLSCSMLVLCQVPQSFNYQAVVRDAGGQVVTNTSINLRISIVDVSATGIVIYKETHSALSNGYGLVNIRVGTGTVISGSFSAIKWGINTKFLKVEMDPAGGTSYIAMGTTQLISVPFALYAVNVENDSVIDADADPGNEIQTVSKAGNTVTLSDGGGSFTDEVNDGDIDPTNELQDISVSGTDLSLTNGSTVDLSVIQDGFTDADADPTNEIQEMSLDGTMLGLTGSDTVDLSVIQDGVIDSDADPSNEIQTISKVGSTVTLSDGGGSFTDDVNDGDIDPANELQDISVSGTDLSLTNGSTVDLSVIQDGVIDADADPINEIQNLSLSGNTLLISSGNSVVLPSDTSAWKKNSTSIYFNGGNVGIGTSTPAEKLHVDGRIYSSSGGFMFPDSTTQLTAASGFTLPYEGISSDSQPFSITTTVPGAAITGQASSTGTSLSVGGYFESQSINGLGVYGVGIGEFANGVHGFANGTDAHAINAVALGSHSIGLYAMGGEYAGVFNGDVFVAGEVGIGTLTPNGSFHVESSKTYAGNFSSDLQSSSTHVIHSEYNGGSADAIAVYGHSVPLDYYGIGAEFTAGYKALKCVVNPTGSYTYFGIDAVVAGGSGTNYAIYGSASGSGTNYAGFFVGDVHVSGVFTNPSDKKLKENIRDFNGALSNIKKLKVHSFQFQKSGDAGRLNLPQGEQVGFIAGELEEVLPNLVSEQVYSWDKNEGIADTEKDVQGFKYKGVNYIGLIPVLTQAIKEQQEMIEQLMEENKEILERLKAVEGK